MKIFTIIILLFTVSYVGTGNFALRKVKKDDKKIKINSN